MSWTDQAASEGHPVPRQIAEHYGWPEGTLALVNDPLRGRGWTPCFSEWPNDLNHYGMKATTVEDVQHLIDLLAKIEESPVQVFLDPRPEPRGLGFTTVLEEGNGIGVMFSIGSQKVIDRWYEFLPEVEPGVRTFGVRRYEKTPKAHPPGLTLYVGNSAVDLAKLRIPAGIEVQPAFHDRYREEHREDPLVQDIERFVREHNAQRTGEDRKAERAAAPQSAEE